MELPVSNELSWNYSYFARSFDTPHTGLLLAPQAGFIVTKNIRGSAAINRKETLNNLCLAAKCDPGSAAVRARSPADISEAGISLLEACLHLCFCAKEAGNPCSIRSSRSNGGDEMLLSPFECKAQRGPLHVPACELFNCPAGYK